MGNTANTVIVNILDKDYQVACPIDEQDDLLKASRELDERMRAIRGGGSVIGLERIAVMAALNLCHELLLAQQAPAQAPVDDAALKRLSEKLDSALGRFG